MATTYLGALLTWVFATTVVAVSVVAIALPAGRSVSIPGLLNLTQDEEQIDFGFGPLLVFGPPVAAALVTPVVIAVRRRVQVRRGLVEPR